MDLPVAVAGTIRRLDLTLKGVATNLAIDEALLNELEESGGPPVLRTWELPGPAVVMGASCRLRDQVDVDACRADGVPIARRSSGGGSVVIGPGALNVAVVLPIDAHPTLRAIETAQRAVLEPIAAALRQLGRPVEILGLGDLVVAGRKVAGSAQRRTRRGVLVHLTILDALPIAWIGRYLGVPPRPPAYRAGRDHAQFVANLGLGRAAVLAAVERAWLPADRPVEPALPPLGRADELVRTKFGDPAWTERL